MGRTGGNAQSLGIARRAGLHPPDEALSIDSTAHQRVLSSQPDIGVFFSMTRGSRRRPAPMRDVFRW